MSISKGFENSCLSPMSVLKKLSYQYPIGILKWRYPPNTSTNQYWSRSRFSAWVGVNV